MRTFVLLLSIAAAAAGSGENSAEHTTKVDENSGSGPPSSLSENKTSGAERGQNSSKEERGGAQVHRDFEADKTAGISGNDDGAEAVRKTMARIDPNAVLKVEIKISKNKNRRKTGAQPPKSGGSDQEASTKSAEESRDGNAKAQIQEGGSGMRSASSQERAAGKHGPGVSSVSHRNGRDTRSGGGLPVKRQVIEVVPCGPKKRALNSQSVSAVPPHSVLSSDTRRLDSFEGGLSVLCILSKNMSLVKEKIPHTDAVGRVRAVLVLKSEGDETKDYWGRLKFRETSGTYIDETGFYEGKLVGSTRELLERGKLTKNGFYQSKDLPDREVEKDFQVTKFLLSAISKAKGTSVADMARESCDLPLVDKLLFARRYTYKEAPKRETVCICSDGLCKGPCKEIKQIDAKKLE